MKTLIIKSKQDSVQLYEEILDNLNTYNLTSISVKLKDNHVVCNINNNEETYMDFISHIISIHIVENIQPRIVREEILLEFAGYIDESVEELIKKITWKLLYRDEDDTETHILNIKNQIKECLSTNEFNLDGFVKFRLNERKKEIQDYIGEELNQILDEEEFDTFISLLRQYIAIKIPKNDLIHFVMIKDKEFEFITGDRQIINMDEIKETNHEFEDLTEYKIEPRDFVLGMMMRLAPKNIIIHTNYKQDPHIVSILNRVYGVRITECSGCEFCESIRTSKNLNKDKK